MKVNDICKYNNKIYKVIKFEENKFRDWYSDTMEYKAILEDIYTKLWHKFIITEGALEYFKILTPQEVMLESL